MDLTVTLTVGCIGVQLTNIGLKVDWFGLGSFLVFTIEFLSPLTCTTTIVSLKYFFVILSGKMDSTVKASSTCSKSFTQIYWLVHRR